MHRESESIIITPGRQVLALFSSVCRLIDTYAQYHIIVKKSRKWVWPGYENGYRVPGTG